MTITADNVANYFLLKVKADEDSGDHLTNLKLQKLLYYAQGCHLAVFNAPFFTEDIEAWGLGPVVPSVYDRLKGFGNNPIALDVNPDLTHFSPHEIELLDEVYEVYGQFSAAKLVTMTHSEPPWATTERAKAISHESMRNYFQTQVAT